MLNTITVEYTQQELQMLTQLLDIAVKAGGLQVAAVATVMHNKHLAAAQGETMDYPPKAPE